MSGSVLKLVIDYARTDVFSFGPEF